MYTSDVSDLSCGWPALTGTGWVADWGAGGVVNCPFPPTNLDNKFLFSFIFRVLVCRQSCGSGAALSCLPSSSGYWRNSLVLSGLLSARSSWRIQDSVTWESSPFQEDFRIKVNSPLKSLLLVSWPEFSRFTKLLWWCNVAGPETELWGAKRQSVGLHLNQS